LRNRIAQSFAGRLGLDEMDSEFVQVYLNSKYIGLYELCEQVRLGKTRVDIFDWEDIAPDNTDLSAYTTENGDDLSGGYLLEINGYEDERNHFLTNAGVPISVKSPEYIASNREMYAYLKQAVLEFEESLSSISFSNSKGQHYTDMVDMDSFVNYWLCCEFFGNVDTGRWQTYFYKDVGKKFVLGPVWDFDSSMGNWRDHPYSSPSQSWMSPRQGEWYSRATNDPLFVSRAQEAYWEHHEYLYNLVYVQVEQYYETMKDAAKAASPTTAPALPARRER
jgi:hypothetical protein